MRTEINASTAAVCAYPQTRQNRHNANTEHVLGAFNTWSFKREQPSDGALLKRFVSNGISLNQPIKFILYWGKGPRTTCAAPDLECLDYLVSLSHRIKTAYSPGSTFTLCLTDTHAALNGHDATATNHYFDAISELALKRGMTSVQLGDLVARHTGKVPPLPVDDTLVEALTRSAAKWYRGPGDPEAGARRYLAMSMIEKVAVQTHAPDAIFISFNGRAFRRLFPDALPIFYMYSLRRGTSLKPWFLDAEGRAIEAME